MKILCGIRDIEKALEDYKTEFERTHGISLKNGTLLCSIGESEYKASEIAQKISVRVSKCSKMIQDAEQKGLIQRTIGTHDKRNMYFTLTPKGKKQLEQISSNQIELPDILAYALKSKK